MFSWNVNNVLPSFWRCCRHLDSEDCSVCRQGRDAVWSELSFVLARWCILPPVEDQNATNVAGTLLAFLVAQTVHRPVEKVVGASQWEHNGFCLVREVDRIGIKLPSRGVTLCDEQDEDANLKSQPYPHPRFPVSTAAIPQVSLNCRYPSYLKF